LAIVTLLFTSLLPNTQCTCSSNTQQKQQQKQRNGQQHCVFNLSSQGRSIGNRSMSSAAALTPHSLPRPAVACAFGHRAAGSLLPAARTSSTRSDNHTTTALVLFTCRAVVCQLQLSPAAPALCCACASPLRARRSGRGACTCGSRRWPQSQSTCRQHVTYNAAEHVLGVQPL
jgi:hypothetical protein